MSGRGLDREDRDSAYARLDGKRYGQDTADTRRDCIPTRPTTGLTFAQAIERVLEGARVRRAHTWDNRLTLGLTTDGRSDLRFFVGEMESHEVDPLDYNDLTARDWMVVE